MHLKYTRGNGLVASQTMLLNFADSTDVDAVTLLDINILICGFLSHMVWGDLYKPTSGKDIQSFCKRALQNKYFLWQLKLLQ